LSLSLSSRCTCTFSQHYILDVLTVIRGLLPLLLSCFWPPTFYRLYCSYICDSPWSIVPRGIKCLFGTKSMLRFWVRLTTLHPVRNIWRCRYYLFEFVLSSPN